MKILRFAGKFCLDTVRLALVGTAALSLVVGGFALANNYLATVPGTGTSFASVVISGTNYLANLICDATAGEGQCAAVKPASTAAAATDPSLVTNESPNSQLSAGIGAAGASHSCASTFSAVGCLGQIDDDVKAVGTIQGNVNVTLTACSGTITTGGTAQNAIAAQTTLHGFTIVNIDTTEPLWISFTTTAAASGTDSYPLQAATATTFATPGSFTAPLGMGTSHALSVIAATTAHKFSCTWW